MTTQALEPTTAAGVSSDITVAAGSTTTVAMFQAPVGANANLKLPGGVDDFLLPASTDFLLLPAGQQESEVLGKRDYGLINLKDVNGAYFPSGLSLRHNGRFKTLGPGVWQLEKPATDNEYGFQYE